MTNTRSIFARFVPLLAWVSVVLAVGATPAFAIPTLFADGVDVPQDQAYAIGGERILSAPGGAVLFGSSGTMDLTIGAGETLGVWIGGDLALNVVAQGPWHSAVFAGEIVAESVRTRQAITATGPITLDEHVSTVLANVVSGKGFTITLPSAEYHPGRRFTVKKISAAGVVRLDAGTVWNNPAVLQRIDGETSLELIAQWSGVMVESTGPGWIIAARP